MRYLVPDDLAEAIRLRQQTGFPLLAGGTDLYPAFEHGFRAEGLIDISRIADLGGPVRRVGDRWVIPALTTWAELGRAELPAQFTGIKQAANQIGGQQIQNSGTVGGNICNASPAADGMAALLALDAAVVLVGEAGQREMALGDFVLGNRRTALAPGEVLHSVAISACRGRHASTFKKLGTRRYLVISIVMLAVMIELDHQRRVRRSGVAVGACSDRALRLSHLEGRLAGRPVQEIGNLAPEDDDLAELAPIDDVRGTAAFRRDVVKRLLSDAFDDIATDLTA